MRDPMETTMLRMALAVAVVGVMMVALSGCGGGASGGAEGAIKESIVQMNDMASVMDNAKNAEEAKPKMETITAKLQKLKTVINAMPELERLELSKKYEAETMKAVVRVLEAGKALEKRDPAGMKKLEVTMKTLAE